MRKDFFESLGKRLGETAESVTTTVTNKTGDAIEIQKLKNQARELSKANASDFIELGRSVYAGYNAGEALSEENAAICEAIKNREAEIAECQKKIAKIKKASECPNCNKMVEAGMAFCPYCGQAMPKPEEAEETDAAGAADDVVDVVDPDDVTVDDFEEEAEAAAAEEVAEEAAEE